jgi:putative DNA primase/helicase
MAVAQATIDQYRAAGNEKMAKMLEDGRARDLAKQPKPKARPIQRAPVPAMARNQSSDGLSVQSARVRFGSEVQGRKTDWLWRGFFPVGKIIMVAGPGGMGKSSIVSDLVSRLTRGAPWPDGSMPPAGMHGVVFACAEEDIEDTLVPRLQLQNANMARVAFIEATIELGVERSVTLADLGAIEDAIDRVPECGLLVVDPVASYLVRGMSENDAADVRSILDPLADLARRKRVTVVTIAHFNKASGNSASHRIRGSSAWRDTVRAAFLVGDDPEDNELPSCDRRKLFINDKMSNARPPETWGCHIRSADRCSPVEIDWDATPTTGIDIDSVFDRQQSRTRATPSQDAAVEFLHEALAGGPVSAAKMRELADQAGHSWATINRAKGAAGATSTKKGFDDGWHWLIPGSSLFNPPEGSQSA